MAGIQFAKNGADPSNSRRRASLDLPTQVDTLPGKQNHSELELDLFSSVVTGLRGLVYSGGPSIVPVE